MSDVEPVPVHIKHDDTKPTGDVKGPPPDRVVTFKTYQTALNNVGNSPECILTQTCYRVKARVKVFGVYPTQALVYLCSSQSDAQQSPPQGALLMPGDAMPIYGTTQVWLVAFGAGLAPLVSVMVETCQSY